MKWRVGRIGQIGMVASVLMVCSGAAASVKSDAGGVAPSSEQAIERGLIYEVRAISPFQVPTHGDGIAIADLNGNGYMDVVLMGHATGMVGFFQNDGTGNFTDRSFNILNGTPVPKATVPFASGITVADFNGNGRPDIYITRVNHQPNILLRNDGDFKFTNIAAPAGVDNVGMGYGAIWGDIDNDGWLDLYVVNYTLPSLAGNPTYRNRMFRNLGDSTFEDISVEMTVDDPGAGLAAVFTDMNRNGWLDLFLANDKGHQPPGYLGNRSWRNNAGQFEDTCDTSGLCLGLWAMSAAAGDVTGNGFPDLYVTNLPHFAGYNGWNPLFLNQGDGTYQEQCTEAGVCQFIFSWTAMFLDYDNNGWQDLFVCNQTQDNRLYANHGQFPLHNVADALNLGGSPGHTYDAAFGDLTGNGALDIITSDYGTNSISRNVQLFINNEGTSRNWARFRVVGEHGNQHAIGSSIEITTNNHTQWRELYAGGNNYKSHNEPIYHFGLADASHIDTMTVTWPGAQRTRTLTNYPANHVWTIYPPHMLGDANGDGQINVSDLLILLSKWGNIQPGAERVDLNSDGVINADDLILLFELWTSAESPPLIAPPTTPRR